MKSLYPLNKYFQAALDRDMLRFHLNRQQEHNSDTGQFVGFSYHLHVDYKENLGATSEDGTQWASICQLRVDNKSTVDVVSRITMMLTERARSAQQDVNIMYKEWTPKR